ncbi:hypothetical protein N7450_006435 [Penicillium hetheringtonii]|uniref:Xylanolytic transcriptional activator regulatory domain-containing protein n=1 Tax=Penicillium hetheringtonii TaxID=911720 RepID=A0AAD6DKQ5_9EURO|nr:hypothetical protein N7450_006435 [Penicillium hetheringtonii]
MKSSEDQGRIKRRKIAVACDDCRTRKVRCDGVQPGELEKKRATQSYIASLEDRIKHLESPRASERTSQPNLTPHPSISSPSPVIAYPETPVDPSRARKCPDQPEATSNSGHDGVNAMMGALEEGRASQGFFGSSSAAGFMRQIKIAVDKRISSPDQPCASPETALHSSLLSGYNGMNQSSIPTYVLPPRRTADSLMEIYWNYVFPLYPFLDCNHMKGEYAKVWRGDTLQYNENMVMCTFNVIFALASQLADFIPPCDREAAADAFFSRAKGLFQFNLWDTGSAGLVQCLLLMAQYLQSTDSAHQCWIVTGLAVRNAQSLGLHLPQTIARFSTFQEQQLARKLWHGCVLMDRVMSMTFGRPAMISKVSSGAVPLPLLVDDEFISENAAAEPMQPSGQPSLLAFYAKTLELYEIMNDVLLSLYRPITDDGADDIHEFYFNKTLNEGEHSIFELDHNLTLWARSLPAHLRVGAAPERDNPVFFRQGIVLNARFLHVRILLFRPILSKYCSIRDNLTMNSLIPISDSFPHRVALQCSIICVRVAQESIEMIYNNVPADGTGGPLPAWWYNILYIYTAATVLIAGRLCPAISSEISDTSITSSWNRALGILRKYQSYSFSAKRCVAALENIVVSEDQQPGEQINIQEKDSQNGPSVLNDIPFGEGINTAMMDAFELPDFQDMSWLNSVPSNLF